MVSAELNFRSSFEQTNVARSFFYPSLTLNATSGLQALELKQWFRTNSIIETVNKKKTQPVFAKRQNKTRIEVAKANQQKA